MTDRLAGIARAAMGTVGAVLVVTLSACAAPAPNLAAYSTDSRLRQDMTAVSTATAKRDFPAAAVALATLSTDVTDASGLDPAKRAQILTDVTRLRTDLQSARLAEVRAASETPLPAAIPTTKPPAPSKATPPTPHHKGHGGNGGGDGGDG